ncbi:MAG: hypothetical protein ACTSWY_07420 [Promethearchaeota archaeon]
MVSEDSILTKNEQRVLYGLVKFPNNSDKDISKKINMVESTFTTIKNRLADRGLFQPYIVPMLNRLGCELMGIIFSNFNLVIPLEQRINITKRTIEVSEEIFLSIGAEEKGFSCSFSKDYTDFASINETRTETFGRIGLLEGEFPHEVIFPFNISKVRNFFNFSRFLEKAFSIEGIEEEKNIKEEWFKRDSLLTLTENEKKILTALIEEPNATTQQLGDKANISKQASATIKNKLFNEYHILKRIVIPNIKKLGFKIFAFYSFKFSPKEKPNEEALEFLNSSSSMFFANRRFEVVIVSVYSDYNAYKEDKMQKFKYLKEKKLITYNPIVRKFEYDRIKVIKDFAFVPITKKILKME